MKNRILASLALISLATTLQVRAESAPPKDEQSKKLQKIEEKIEELAKIQSVAYVRLGYLQRSLPEWRSAEVEYEDFAANITEAMQAKSEELDDLRTDIDADPQSIPDSVKKQRTAEVLKIYKDMLELQQSLARKRGELFGPIQKKIKQATAKVAKEKGYKFVHKKDESVLYADETCDISDLVLEALGVTPTGKKGEEASTQEEATTD